MGTDGTFQFRVLLNGNLVEKTVAPGDSLLVPQGAIHYFFNTDCTQARGPPASFQSNCPPLLSSAPQADQQATGRGYRWALPSSEGWDAAALQAPRVAPLCGGAAAKAAQAPAVSFTLFSVRPALEARSSRTWHRAYQRCM